MGDGTARVMPTMLKPRERACALISSGESATVISLFGGIGKSIEEECKIERMKEDFLTKLKGLFYIQNPEV
jgi:hypothetical protein